MSAAAIADPVTGAERRVKKSQEPALPAGVLTAGSFDDNIDPRAFLSFLKRLNRQHGLQDVPAKMQGQRLMIHVKDSAGKPVGGARVQLIAQTGQAAELITRTDGRAVFMTSFDNLPADAALTASVTPPDGGAAVTEKIDAGAPRWEITLPAAQARLPRNLDLAIVLDTTGSMGDELDFLKGEIRGISKVIHDRFPEVQQRFALVVYRDDRDDYVSRIFDFKSLEAFHQNLSAQRSGGGGDFPEAVHRGLEDANQLTWRSQDTARVLFWVADAPPHAQHMNRTMAAAGALRKQGITIYPMACSGYDDGCELTMRSAAMLTGGQFLFLTDDSGVGASHAEPKIPYYHVEHLEKLMVRMIAGELAGQRIEANPAEVIRTVGRKVN
ncbi:MAG: VWA domain-containing protein [Gemmataceae bacterium]|nr:VWA domain-containing protein [Gemmataceae bacterium]